MNEFINQATDNFKDVQKEISELCLVDIIKAYDYINALSMFVQSNNEILDDMNDIIRPLEKIIVRCKTSTECPHCGALLFKSDLPQYDYFCFACDENF